MTPPCPIFALKCGINSLRELAVLWHLAQCGATGTTVHALSDATRIPYNTAYANLRTLLEHKLVIDPRGGEGRSRGIWTISRLGYAFATHNNETKHDPSLPIPTITLKT
jgi:DNA-binding IclR family transcriptional regulator